MNKTSIEAKRDLVKALQLRKKILAKKKLESFKPNRGQELPFNSKAQTRIVCGANRGGKTTWLVVECLMLALGIHPHIFRGVPLKGRIVSTDFGKGINTVIYPKIKEWCPENSIKSIIKNQQGSPILIEFINGSVIELMSYEQPSSKFEGADLDFVAFDEPPPRPVYIASVRGLVDRDGLCMFAMTPLSEPWIYDELWVPGFTNKDSDVRCFIINQDDNMLENGGHIPRLSLEKYNRRMRPEEREARIHGKWLHLTGRVFTEFNLETHVIDVKHWPAGWPVYESIDPHLRKPHCVIWMGVTPQNQLLIIDELEFKGTMDELAEKIKEKRRGKRIICSIVDSFANQPNMVTNTTGRDILTSKGIYTQVAGKNEKDWETWADVIRDFLLPKNSSFGKLPTLLFFRTCEKTIRSFENLMWDNYKNEEKYGPKEKLQSKYKDFFDCVQYAIACKPRFRSNFKEITYVSSFESYTGRKI